MLRSSLKWGQLDQRSYFIKEDTLQLIPDGLFYFLFFSSQKTTHMHTSSGASGRV